MMTEQKLRILCVGMPVRDLTFRVDAVPARGSKIRTDDYTELSGGNAPNAAIGIARLGGEVRLSGPMGDAEEHGAEFIYKRMASEGIDTTHLVRVSGATTPVSAVISDSGGERTIVTYRDPKLWKVELPRADTLLDGCAALLTENRCAEFVTDLCLAAKQRGLPVVLDADQVMALREGLLTASTHIVFSEEALRATAGIDDLEAALRRIAELTPAFVAVTRGQQGVIWLDNSGEAQSMPSFPVHVVDTLGAGDIFHGAFTLATAEGQGIRDAMRFATAAAALKCTKPGGPLAAPSRAEVVDFLAKDRR